MKSLLMACEAQFALLHVRNLALLAQIPAEKLYWQPRAPTGFMPVYSCGEYLLRSAGAIEQTFGGLTVRLWDDPFEWTLPETLATHEKINEYLHEADATRQRGFALLQSDADLAKDISTPAGVQTIAALLLATLARAFYYQGCAAATFRLFSDGRLPRW